MSYFSGLVIMVFPFAIGNGQAQQPLEFNPKHEILVYQRSTSMETGPESINPRNSVAGLSENLLSLNFRGDYKLKYGWMEGSWGPRGILNASLSDFDQEAQKIEYLDWELYSQFAKFKSSFGKNLYVQGGRYRMDWGPSSFVSSSNPFVIETGRVNPKVESPPRDFMQINYALDSWELGLIANLGEGEDPAFASPLFNFSRTYAAILDNYGQSQNLSVILSADEEGHRSIGGYGQKSLSNSVVTWVDGALEENIHLYVPTRDTAFIKWDMVDDQKRNGQMFHAALAGISYTTVLGPTLSFEYYHNDKGYDQDESKVYYSMIEESAAYRFDLLALLGRRNLGRALNLGQAFMLRDYLFFQAGQTDAWGQLDYNLRYVQNMNDGSGQLSGIFEWNLANRWQIFMVGLLGIGNSHTEFGRFLDRQIMTGFIFRT